MKATFNMKTTSNRPNQSNSSKPNIPSQIYQTNHTKKPYQIKPTKSDQTKPIKPKYKVEFMATLGPNKKHMFSLNRSKLGLDTTQYTRSTKNKNS